MEHRNFNKENLFISVALGGMMKRPMALAWMRSLSGMLVVAVGFAERS